MDPRPFTNDLLYHLRKRERLLLRRYGVRLRVDKITADGKSALCSIAQVRRPWFRPVHSADVLIELAHATLMPLHHVGLSPLVSVLPCGPKTQLPNMDKNDPFNVHRALLHAGQEAPQQFPPIVRNEGSPCHAPDRTARTAVR